MVEALVSKRGSNGFSNQGCKCFHMGNLLVACIDPQHWLVQLTCPSLKEQAGNVILDA